MNNGVRMIIKVIYTLLQKISGCILKGRKIMEGLFLIIQSKNGQNSNNLTHKLFFL